MTRNIERGTIWLANLNPGKGTEPGKTRPVLIPLRVRVKAQEQLERNSDLVIDQIRAIDNKRLTSGPLATLEPELMQRIQYAVLEVTGMGSVFVERI